MKSNGLCHFMLAAIIPLFTLAQGCGDSGEFSNTVPSDLQITIDACFVPTGGIVQLVGSASDADGDPLTFTWKASKGSFTPASATGEAVQWAAPADPGDVAITMTVTDEIAKLSQSITVTVCSRLQIPALGNYTIQNTGNTYILLKDGLQVIQWSDTLTIEPGVKIVVDKGAGGFEIFGCVHAKGTPASGIRLQGNTCSGGVGLWSGIYLRDPGSEAVLSHVDVTMSRDGIQVYDGARLATDNCEIYDNENCGIGVNNAGAEAVIRSCTVWDNGVGIQVINGAAEIRRSSIRYSAGNGIDLFFSAYPTPVVIDSCSIASNGYSGIALSEMAAPEIHFCAIFSNGERASSSAGYALRLFSYDATDSIQAQNNYWGSNATSVSQISTLVHDAKDDPVSLHADVDFTPYLTSSPVTTAALEDIAKGRSWERLWR